MVSMLPMTVTHGEKVLIIKIRIYIRACYKAILVHIHQICWFYTYFSWKGVFCYYIFLDVCLLQGIQLYWWLWNRRIRPTLWSLFYMFPSSKQLFQMIIFKLLFHINSFLNILQIYRHFFLLYFRFVLFVLVIGIITACWYNLFNLLSFFPKLINLIFNCADLFLFVIHFVQLIFCQFILCFYVFFTIWLDHLFEVYFSILLFFLWFF